MMRITVLHFPLFFGFTFLGHAWASTLKWGKFCVIAKLLFAAVALRDPRPLNSSKAIFIDSSGFMDPSTLFSELFSCWNDDLFFLLESVTMTFLEDISLFE